MFNDIRMSAQLMDAYKDHIRSSGRKTTDLTVKVLATGFWPGMQTVECRLPPDLFAATQFFERFYAQQHTGRLVTWQWTMGNADLRARFPASSFAAHDINVPTLQMLVLLCFNAVDTLGYGELAEQTGMPAGELKRALQSLACGKHRVLVKTPKGKDVGDSDSFSFNDKLAPKMMRFKISAVVAQRENEAEKEKTRHKVDEDRKPQIDAGIVRVMKSRRQSDHNNLVAEVTRQLQSRFQPNPSLIKKRIEDLIEREFLERVPGDMKQYRYVA